MSATSGSITGRVIDAEGQPVSGATVAITGGTQPFPDIAAVTNSQGAFRFGGMQPGSYDLEVHKGTATGQAQVVVSAPTNVEIQIG